MMNWMDLLIKNVMLLGSKNVNAMATKRSQLLEDENFETLYEEKV